MAAAPATAPKPTATGEPRNPYQCPFPLTGTDVSNEGAVYTTMSLEDILTFRNMADDLTGFHLRHIDEDHPCCFVWDKKIPGEDIHMVKMFGVLEDIPPELLYDVLQDPIFRIQWDEARKEGFRVTLLNDTNEIGFYGAKLPGPLSDRSFLNQRAWNDAGNGEYVICNTSVRHAKYPAAKEKGYERAFSKISGYLVRPWPPEGVTVSGPLPTGKQLAKKDSSSAFGKPMAGSAGTPPPAGPPKRGCSLTYLTLSDPCGSLPSSIINYVTTKFAPKTLGNLKKASKQYEEWTSKQPNYSQPWKSLPAMPWPGPAGNQVNDFVLTRLGLGTAAPPASPGPIGMTPRDQPSQQQDQPSSPS